MNITCPSVAPEERRRMDGKKVADEILERLQERVAILREKNIIPTLGIILIGSDPRSQTYVRVKTRAAEKLGIEVRLEIFETNESISKIPLNPPFTKGEDSPLWQRGVRPPALRDPRLGEGDLINIQTKIEEWNNNNNLHGMIIQLPLPNELQADELKIIESVDPNKDVDGLHPLNLGRLLRGKPSVEPPTPKGIITLLDAYDVEIRSSLVTLIGFGKLVGRALSVMLIDRGATLTVATKSTVNLAETTQQADIIISAAGQANLITAEMIKDDATLIDVGLSEVDDRLIGDISLEAKQKARLATPTPGGVGPMTVAMLLSNVVEVAERFGGINAE